LPHLGTCLPALPAFQGLPPYSDSLGRLYTAGSTFPARAYGPRGTPPDVGRLHVLPHCSRPLHPLAGSRPYPGHHSRHRGTRSADRLDITLAKLCGIQLSRKTAHHPAANGLVERFHRTLKAAIICHAHQNWTEALPLVLLGIRTSFIEDLQASVAELVYGEPLRIPGEILTPTPNPVDPALLITELRQHMARLRPFPAARHASPATFVHSDLGKFTHVFFRQDTARRALEPPTVAPTRFCHGERRHCNFSCSVGPLPCQPTGSSRPTSSVEPTAVTAASNSQPMQPRPHHHLPHRQCRPHALHAWAAISISLLASTSEQPSPWGGG
jgi:hypothetical protein